MNDNPMLSRSGSTGPMGKLTDELNKLPIDSETKARLQLMAAQRGVPFAEFHRDILMCVAWGADTLATMQAKRIRDMGALLGGNWGGEGESS